MTSNETPLPDQSSKNNPIDSNDTNDPREVIEITSWEDIERLNLAKNDEFEEGTPILIKLPQNLTSHLKIFENIDKNIFPDISLDHLYEDEPIYEGVKVCQILVSKGEINQLRSFLTDEFHPKLGEPRNYILEATSDDDYWHITYSSDEFDEARIGYIVLSNRPIIPITFYSIQPNLNSLIEIFSSIVEAELSKWAFKIKHTSLVVPEAPEKKIPIKPRDISNYDDWFDYYHACKKAKFKYTLNDLANDVGISSSHAKRLHALYKAEHLNET